MRGFAAAVLLLLLPALAPAEMSITLPDDGLYRPGQYLSVAISGAGAAGDLLIEADGALPTIVRRPAGRLVAPLLVIEPSLSNLRIRSGAATTSYAGSLRPAPAQAAPLAGPAGSIFSEEAYRPTFGWRPGWAWPIRRNALALAAAFTAVMAGGWPPRRWRWRLSSRPGVR
jgi:hypothetical protein